MYILKKLDLWIILAVLLIALLIWLVQAGFSLRSASQAQGELRVYLGEELYETLPLTGEAQEYTLEQADGSINRLQVTAQGAYMAYANCPNQDCEHQSEVTIENHTTRALGSWIICLPNGVSVELRAGAE